MNLLEDLAVVSGTIRRHRPRPGLRLRKSDFSAACRSPSAAADPHLMRVAVASPPTRAVEVSTQLEMPSGAAVYTKDTAATGLEEWLHRVALFPVLWYIGDFFFSEFGDVL